MAYKEKEIEKLYFSIGEVAELFNVAPSLIRFWESEFDLIKPKKNRKGNRQFTKEDLNLLTVMANVAAIRIIPSEPKCHFALVS